MFIRLLIIVLFPLCALAQPPVLKEVVARKHDNGNPHVVLYFETEYNTLVKEQVFFANGKTEWSGNYKNNKEDGEWQFYWDNGNLKSKETYVKGKEHGTSISYDRDGKKIKEVYWKHGKQLKEVVF